ncbi:hypothetical protein V8G54_005688 [Vigna mungo]|uniref:UFSP1/2/DUB catalytic domain-containing protein n=1 Tax=Vigna mungo TaxID=3915 RepID=A0AAQ3P063_VIGMU
MDSDQFTTCPFCDSCLPLSQLTRESKQPRLLSGAKYSGGGETSSENGECKMNDRISCLIVSQTRCEFQKVEAGLMTLLKNCLESEIGNSISILSGYVDHFQCLESEDAGWRCGWRNIQMLSSHLLVQRPEARKALFGGSGFVPDILSLQRARVVDFGPKESQSIPGSSADNARNETSIHLVKQKDKEGSGYQVLMDFVWNYFLDENSIQFGQKHVLISEKTPLYFQHDGHSRTIVGIQVNYQQKRHLQYNLLILDPAQRTAALERSLRQKVRWEELKEGNAYTKEATLCYVDPGIASEGEVEKLKTIDSIFLEF